MAKISATEFFRFENFDPEIIGKRVGHNRTVSHARRERGRTIIGSLHGHPVFELCELAEKPGHYEVRFDTCGWTTVTTRQAMTDFAQAAGIRAAVSMAGGELSVALCHPVGGQEPMPTGGSIARRTLSPEEFKQFTDLREIA